MRYGHDPLWAEHLDPDDLAEVLGYELAEQELRLRAEAAREHAELRAAFGGRS